MSDQFISGVGGILTADIAVPEYDHIVQYYSYILNTGKNPLWREDLMNNLGMPVIGLGKRSAEYADLPLQWMPHIQVDDIALSVQRALEMGGSEILHGKDDDGKSQWAVLLDPNGAAFGMIPVISEENIPSTDGAKSIGCISWIDITVINASVICDFYQRVIGWSVQNSEIQEASERYVDFNMIGGSKTPDAVIKQARSEDIEFPSVWMLYLPVNDILESLHRVTEQGGKVIKEKIGADGTYEYAIVQDPVGVCLGLIPG